MGGAFKNGGDLVRNRGGAWLESDRHSNKWKGMVRKALRKIKRAIGDGGTVRNGGGGHSQKFKMAFRNRATLKQWAQLRMGGQKEQGAPSEMAQTDFFLFEFPKAAILGTSQIILVRNKR